MPEQPPASPDVLDRVRTLVRERGTDPLADPRAVRAAILDVLDEVSTPETERELAEVEAWARELHDLVAGYGPLQRLFDDPDVEELWTCSGWFRACLTAVARVSAQRVSSDQIPRHTREISGSITRQFCLVAPVDRYLSVLAASEGSPPTRQRASGFIDCEWGMGMTEQGAVSTAEGRQRRLTWPALVGLMVVFALLPSFIDVFVLHSRAEFTFPDLKSVTDHLIAASISMLVAVLAVTWLRWWPETLQERLRTRRWVWVVPISLLVVSIGLLDYTRSSQAGGLLVATLFLTTLCIATGEELLFRGIVLTFLRSRYREGIAAGVSSLLFGLIHFPAGPVQVLFSMAFGYLLYLTRRVSGGILLPIIVHAFWDFSVFTSFTTASPGTSNASPALALLTVVLLAATLVARKRIDPAPSSSA